MRLIKYTRELDIRNIGALPAGLGCKYLVCYDDTRHGVLIAAYWKRKLPKSLKQGYVIVGFE